MKTVPFFLTSSYFITLPVGALTSKPYAFSARPWELEQVESIDFFDSVGSNIRVDTRGGTIMRVLPRVNEAVNEEWISDKIRFSYDGFKRQRLDRPLGRVSRLDKTTSNLTVDPSAVYRSLSWNRVLRLIKLAVRRKREEEIAPVHFALGRMTDFPTLLLAKECITSYSYRFASATGLVWNAPPVEFLESRVRYLSPPFSQIASSNLLLLVGVNPRVDLPVFSLRLRRLPSLPIFIFGSGSVGGSRREINLGGAVSTLVQIAEGRHPICRSLSSKSTILLGEGVFGSRPVDSSGIFRLLSSISRLSSARLSYLHSFASTVSAAELGLIPPPPVEGGKKPVLWILDNDEIQFEKSNFSSVVYQGHHGDRAVSKSDFILPSPLPLEKETVFLNYEGRYQKIDRPISTPPGLATAESTVLLRLLNSFSHPSRRLVGSNLESWVTESYGGFYDGPLFHLPLPVPPPVKLERGVIQPPVSNFYSNDSVSRASSNMAIASTRFHRPSDNFKQF